MEEQLPSTPWRRRRTTDSPRPAGRRWAGRLRRSGTLARQALLVRVGRRPRDAAGRAATATRAEVIYTGTELVRVRPAPHPPTLTPAPAAIEAEPESLSLLPGVHTTARKIRFALVNACTLASLGLGLTAIFLAMHGQVRVAAACLIAC